MKFRKIQTGSLRHCPFCGREPELLKIEGSVPLYAVKCRTTRCHASIGREYTSAEEAIRSWNRRDIRRRDQILVCTHRSSVLEEFCRRYPYYVIPPSDELPLTEARNLYEEGLILTYEETEQDPETASVFHKSDAGELLLSGKRLLLPTRHPRRLIQILPNALRIAITSGDEELDAFSVRYDYIMDERPDLFEELKNFIEL